MIIAGVDEAGRGPCLGPLVLGLAMIKKTEEEALEALKLKDSKELRLSERIRLNEEIRNFTKHSYTLSVDSKELDELMERKSLNEIEAMKIASLLNSVNEKPDTLYVDAPDPIASEFGKRIKKYLSFPLKIYSEHKADQKYPIVSAASILAKVKRDNIIDELKEKHGEIGSGYPHDEKTITFVKQFISKHKKPPSFARTKWETIKRLVNAEFQQKLF